MNVCLQDVDIDKIEEANNIQEKGENLSNELEETNMHILW